MPPRIYAHRGASGVCGEDNTLRGFARAIAQGADGIELDVRRCRDGSLVCFHDAEAGGRPLGGLSRAELRDACALDVPALADAVALCAGRIDLDVELKEHGYEEEVLLALADVDPRRLVLTSFLPSALRRLRALRADLRLGLLVDGPAGDPAGLPDRLAESAADFLACHHSWCAPSLWGIPALHAVEVWTWTVDAPERLRALAGLPVAAVISNRPDIAAAVYRPAERALTRAEVGASIAAARGGGDLVDALGGVRVGDARTGTRSVRIGRGVRGEIRDWSCALWGAAAGIAVVMDAHTREAAGADVLRMLPHAREVLVEPLAGWRKVTPHGELSQRIQAAAAGADALVAVGAGTINDLTKHAAQALGRPYAVVATAASMNGYTSGIAALLVDGLKRTLPCAPPELVLADVDVVAAAPPALARAGYADLLSKPFAEADWRLAAHVRDEAYDDLPGQVVTAAVARCLDAAAGIAAGEPAAIEALMEALVLSGHAMALAGSSAPASGGEHLLSHLWDMRAYAARRQPALHGLQVGLACLLSARLWELMDAADPGRFRWAPRDPETLRTAHGRLWPAVADEARRQLLDAAAGAARVARIRERWPEIRRDCGALRVSWEAQRHRLRLAGIDARPSELGLAHEDLRHAVLHAADVRDRYTILHLARDVGMLGALVDEVVVGV